MTKFIITIFILLVLQGCGEPQVEIIPIKDGNDIEFQFKHKNINGLIHLTLWEKDTRKTLWDINLRYYSGDILKYGEVPKNFIKFNERKDSALQYFPKDNEPPIKIPIEKTIYVYLQFQYDTFISSNAGSKFCAFIIRNNGELQILNITYPPSDEWPDIFKSAEQGA